MTANVHVISHTHWDREWYLTFEQYRARLVALVDAVLDRMARDPAFTYFHLDGQSVVLEDYLEIRPERESEVRMRVGEGRLLIGPWYVMPDMFLVSGEALVRNLAAGIRMADGFGQSMRVGYMPDPFGHVAQMPQILAGFGLDGAILWRGFGGPRAEYVWEGSDGTRVTLLHLPRDGYCNGLRLPLLPADRMPDAAASVVSHERGRSSTGEVLLMVGVDHVEPHPALSSLIAVLNRGDGARARLSTLPEYVRGVERALQERRVPLDVVSGELRGGEDYAHLLPGVFSARLYLKQANAAAQRELEQWAEPLAAFAFLCGDPIPRGSLQYAWRTLLQNHPHDSICGCSIDEVHEENLTRFARARQAAATVLDRAADAIGRRVPPGPSDAIRALALNTSAAEWSGVVEATIDIPIEPAESGREIDLAALEHPVRFFGKTAGMAAVTDADGRPLPFQVLSVTETVRYAMSRYSPPVGLRVLRTAVAIGLRNVPPLGYAALDVRVANAASPGAPAVPGTSVENDVVRLDPRADGTVDVLDKRTGARYEAAFSLEDTGDVGDEYNYSPPASDRRVTNREARDVRVRRAANGPLVWSLLIDFALPVPACADPTRRSRAAAAADLRVSLDLRLRAGSPIVDCTGTIDNDARDHRLRMLFPTNAGNLTHHRADSAFGIVTRPAVKDPPRAAVVEAPVASAPMQSFVDAGDERSGATVVTDGLVEFEALPALDGAPLALTLIRSVGDLSRDDLRTRRGHAGPGLATPGAQCPGTRPFRLAFVPRSAPPPAGELYATARAVLSPPRIVSPCGGSGELAGRGTFVDVRPEPDLVLSACKVADEGDGVVLRIFNAGDSDRTLSVPRQAGVRSLHRTDLLERRKEECPGDRGGWSLAVPRARIETVALDGGDAGGQQP